MHGRYLEGVTLSRRYFNMSLGFQENIDLNGLTYSLKPRHTDRYDNTKSYAIIFYSLCNNAVDYGPCEKRRT
jgi:hypothetical protein